VETIVNAASGEVSTRSIRRCPDHWADINRPESGGQPRLHEVRTEVIEQERPKVRTYIDSHVMNRLNPKWLARSQRTKPCGEASRVLIVDDEASCRLGFRVALEAAGYEIAEAADGETALEQLRNDPADLALLDLQMPLLDGMETLRRLREEGIDVPVVVVTAYGSVPLACQAMSLGALDVLPKPVKPAALRQIVFEALLRRAYAGDDPHRFAPSSLGASAHRFSETLTVARKAWRQGQFPLAEELVDRALDLNPDSAEAHALRGALKESLGEHHSAYHSYRRALANDRHYGPALDGLRRYCERSGLDFNDTRVNPAAE
jgi:DNA-binding response OmpR family regulator